MPGSTLGTGVPETVRAALADRPVEGQVCLEAGAGVGNTTAGLLESGAGRVYAVTDDADHAAAVQRRCGDDDRVDVVRADLRATPLRPDSVELVSAHGLCNLLDPAALEDVAAELTRVAAPGSHLVVDDYDPLPEDAAVRRLFAVENAASELADGRPALTFYPAALLKRVFEGHGWSFDRERTLLDPVPWTESHLSAHTRAACEAAGRLPDDLGAPLERAADRVAADVGAASTGRMYSLAFRWSE
ncbi:class I SAM-dependent methyltransferase [Halomicroarcula sp. GCM10025817]|uniref:class I SAM-dependent methyltransferase n=1 Tax=Haloarcula TaxID=2237 RepID=UPI0023E77DE5|nr:methyltransferase domain-containing protein [Halomicroarcula sp. SYNS111]